MLFFDRDISRRCSTSAGVAGALLAAWCIGRPYGVAPAGAGRRLGGARLADLVEFQAGEALNDITGVAFILGGRAILVNGYAARRTGGGRPCTGDPE